MRILGLQLRTPCMSGLLTAAIALLLTIALIVLVSYFLKWDFAQLTPLFFGGAGGVIASAFGVNVRTDGFRGVLVTALFSAALVAVSLAFLPLVS